MKLPQQVKLPIRKATLNTIVVKFEGIYPSQCQCNHGYPSGTANNNYGCPPGLQPYCRDDNSCVCTNWTFGTMPGDPLQYGPLYKGGNTRR